MELFFVGWGRPRLNREPEPEVCKTLCSLFLTTDLVRLHFSMFFFASLCLVSLWLVSWKDAEVFGQSQAWSSGQDVANRAWSSGCSNSCSAIEHGSFDRYSNEKMLPGKEEICRVWQFLDLQSRSRSFAHQTWSWDYSMHRNSRFYVIWSPANVTVHSWPRHNKHTGVREFFAAPVGFVSNQIFPGLKASHRAWIAFLPTLAVTYCMFHLTGWPESG